MGSGIEGVRLDAGRRTQMSPIVIRVVMALEGLALMAMGGFILRRTLKRRARRKLQADKEALTPGQAPA